MTWNYFLRIQHPFLNTTTKTLSAQTLLKDGYNYCEITPGLRQPTKESIVIGTFLSVQRLLWQTVIVLVAESLHHDTQVRSRKKARGPYCQGFERSRLTFSGLPPQTRSYFLFLTKQSTSGDKTLGKKEAYRAIFILQGYSHSNHHRHDDLEVCLFQKYLFFKLAFRSYIVDVHI